MFFTHKKGSFKNRWLKRSLGNQKSSSMASLFCNLYFYDLMVFKAFNIKSLKLDPIHFHSMHKASKYIENIYFSIFYCFTNEGDNNDNSHY